MRNADQAGDEIAGFDLEAALHAAANHEGVLLASEARILVLQAIGWLICCIAVIMKRLHKPEVMLSCSLVSGIIQQVAQEVQLGISAMIRGDGAYVATKGAFVDLLRSR